MSSGQNRGGTNVTEQMNSAWAIVENPEYRPLDRLRASEWLRRALRSFEANVAVECRSLGSSWHTMAEELGITKQAAFERFARTDASPVVHILTGVDRLRNAVWYGLEGDTPAERHYAHTRDECMEAYQLARRRADAIVEQLGPPAVVNDGGIDRGSGTFWDLYMGR
jgi:hypothetical protein